jgi:nucleotide-binding universal stress UspA family protein
MLQTAHADPHEPRDTSAAPRPREAFGLQTHSSECAEAAGRVAVDLANRSGAELEVVHAFEFGPAREYAGVALRLRPLAELAKQGQRVLDAQVGQLRQMGGEVADARLCVGSPVN